MKEKMGHRERVMTVLSREEADRVPPENIVAMYRTAIEYGKFL
jgi:hypothetical protein